MKRPGPKIEWRNIRISRDDHEFVVAMCQRLTRSGADQLSHIIKIYRTIFAEFGHDDVETIVKALRTGKK